MEIRGALAKIAAEAGLEPPLDTETTADVLTRMLETTEKARETARTQNSEYREAREIIVELLEIEARLEERAKEHELRQMRLSDVAGALRSIQRERDVANAVVRAAITARSQIVGRVFNKRLNAIWHDLFVRLAPNEQYVPAFMLPKDSNAPINALLETVHRQGDRGGRPGALLSTGNLNTAALTLFLSLHLSVVPHVPWLVLDDPVQSMDELHVAQFAALLRTLAKAKKGN